LLLPFSGSTVSRQMQWPSEQKEAHWLAKDPFFHGATRCQPNELGAKWS